MTDHGSPGRIRVPRPDETDEFFAVDERDLLERTRDLSDDAFERFVRRGVPLPTPPDAPEAGGGAPAPEVRRGRRAAAWLFTRVAWLVVASLIGLGSAGIVSAMAHPPETGSRPELTWAADQSFGATLDEAVKDVDGISAQVEALANLARSARGSLTQQNRVALDAAVADGNKIVLSILSSSADLDARLGCAQGSRRFLTVNNASLIDRFDRICLALASTTNLRDDWVALADGARTAMQVSEDIAAHDQTAAAAVLLGSKRQYADAIAKLDQAKGVLGDVRRSHDLLAAIADVSTLGQWVDRTQAMDDALDAFWEAMIQSKGKVTPKVQQALQAVNEARDMLPADAQYMAIVLSEMAQGGVDQAAISIGSVKGRLAAAVEALDQGGGNTP